MTNTTSAAPAFCSGCGAKNSGGSFCAECGSALGRNGNPAPTPRGPYPKGPSGTSSENPNPFLFVARGAAASQVAEFVELPGRGAVRLGSMGQRAAARIIDVIVVVVGYLVLAAFFAILTTLIARGSGSFGSSGGAAVAGFFGFILALFLIGLLAYVYEVVMITAFGRTVGKMALRLRVVRTDGNKPNIVNALLRFVTPIGAYLIPIFGPVLSVGVFASPAFDSSGRRQGWHDKLGGTFVTSDR